MSSSSDYETTYSEDARIERALREERKQQKQLERERELARKQLFEELFDSDLPIKNVPALKFHTFRHTKIKFSFQPSKITKFVTENVRFFVSLKYVDTHWRVKRDSLPANYKWKIYNLFYNGTFVVDDENILPTLGEIYELLVAWIEKDEKFRKDKFQRYKNGEDIELDSDDEKIFLNQNERVERLQRKTKMLRSMMWPPGKKPRSLVLRHW